MNTNAEYDTVVDNDPLEYGTKHDWSKNIETKKLMKSNLNYKGEILIVDDDPINLDLLLRMLKSQQYIVRVANSGRMALTVINSSMPDLILLDINMPNMNGYEVCQRIKQDPNCKDIPIIFISANHEAIDKVQAFKVGGIDYVTKPFQMEEVLARIETQLKIARLSHELQMQMLRYQLDPHFLFNALNSVRTLISVDGDTAEEMLIQLADYLRYLLVTRNSPEIPILEELEAAHNYLAIEKIRFKGKLQITTDIDPAVEKYLVPPSILQPILENAIKYGMKSTSAPLEINISIKYNDDKICLKITNTGKWINPTDSAGKEKTGFGVGLTNIRQQLRTRYPGRHKFLISNDQETVTVLIEIPVT